MEDKRGKVGDSNEASDDLESVSEDSLEDNFDDEVVQLPGHEDGLQCEELLTESEIEELVAELIEVESKAAEAQESLEKESLEKVEQEVREELAQTLQGDDLEQAVAEEIATFKEEWEAVLDELEAESAVLSEQLDGAGIDLTSIYKWIESQAPSGCSTEAWRKRTHWVGSNITSDAAESIADADKQLQTIRPIRRRHGKILEEGASGYLAKKLVTSDEGVAEHSEADWSSLNKLFSGHTSEEIVSFGSKQWVSVYLASTPQQAANMGVKFPGVDEVEEIDELDGNSSDPFLADAFANERELDLSEEQKRNYKKVKEEDDANVDKRLHIHLKRRRQRKISKQEFNRKVIAADELVSSGTSVDGHHGQTDDAASIENEVLPSQNETAGALDGSQSLTDALREKKCLASSIPCSDDASMSKSLQDGEEVENENRTCQISNSDSEMDSVTYVDRQPIVQENGGHSVSVPADLDKIEDFRCTACDKLLIEAHRHPILRVIVCWECKCVVESKMNQDPDCLECYCGWCGRRNKLISCKSCETFFCVYCIKRNIGEKCWSELELRGWQCCCCSPDVLQRFASEYEKAFAHGDLEVSDSESDSGHSEGKVDISISLRKRRKRKIRRIIDDAELGEETRKKIAIEKERQERLKSLQAQLSRRSMMMDAVSCDGSLPEGATSEVLGDASTGFIVNVRRESGEAAARIAPSISAKLKAHQVSGIRFMWENVIESVSKVKAGDKGLGCILAHTMGLGKTLQVIAFLYTAMKSVDLGLKSALIVAPVNVLHNWRQEFVKWQPSEYKPFRIFMLEDVSRERRSNLIKKWRMKGGVFLIGYTAFRDLSLGKNVKDRRTAQEISCDLQEGPDILICDEAHIIKNNGADTTQALKQVKCQRRIALTGSPLQNNLMEYYCMVDFVREGFLGSSHEFRNRFQNPIENGQHTNSTAVDVRIMNQRSHILYEQLKGFVQRMGLSVVKKDLPPKTVFVVAVKLSPLQRKLYKRFLDVHGFSKDKAVCEGMRRKSFFAGYQALAQICNHPWILQLMKEREYARREDVEHYLADDISSDENVDFNVVSEDKVRHKVESMHRRNDHLFLHEGWWNDLLNKDNHQEVNYSGKMILLLDILTMCSNLGDKALVFSQSIPTLDLIEFYLSKLVRPGKKGKHWKPGRDWYRIDGKTKGSERQKMVELFNNPQNKRVKCTLISTKAGSLGINLYAANRVIIVDGSWNPTHDLQAIYRAWRYGQMKPVYAYRLVAHGTMEEKIYKRQVTKEGLAARVVDRQQVHRTISKEEMLHLFEFGDDEDLDTLPGLEESSCHLTSNISGKLVPKKGLSFSLKNHPSDRFMEVLLSRHHPRWITNVHEHETLLQENEEEKLTKEEQDMAWEGYRRSMEWEEVHRVPVDESTFNQNETTTSMAHRGQDTHFHSDVQLNSDDPNSRDPLAQNDDGISRAVARLSRRMSVRKCTGISHLMTLKVQGTKSRCSTVCGECAREIGWEDFS